MPQTDKIKASAITFRISETDKQKLATLADMEGMNQTEYITFLIRANYRDFERAKLNEAEKMPL